MAASEFHVRCTAMMALLAIVRVTPMAGAEFASPAGVVRRKPAFVVNGHEAVSTEGNRAKYAVLSRPVRRRRQANNNGIVRLESTAASSYGATLSSRISDAQLKELAAKDYVIIQNFIPENLIGALREDVSNLRSKNKFRVARIGQDSTNTLNQDIRVAETCFIGPNKLQDCTDNEGARTQLYDILDTLRSDLSENPALGDSAPELDPTLSETLYAYYPEGGFYRRHRDAIPESASILRSYSLLLYLNDDWKPEDGGELRLHRDSGGDFLPEGEEPNYLDVEPHGGTLVLFKSEKIPHEVLDTKSNRLAVVGWYNRAMKTSDITSIASDSDKTRAMMLLVSAALVTVGVVTLLQ